MYIRDDWSNSWDFIKILDNVNMKYEDKRKLIIILAGQ